MTDRRALRVRSMVWEAEGILGVELVPFHPGTLLPPAEPGAHIDLHLGNGLARSYSLTNPGDSERWCVAVHHSPGSRGGSRWIHQNLRPGDVMEVGGPRNMFPLDTSAPHTVLIAGGIGVTPLFAMARQLSALGRPWTLHYACRTKAQMAFADELQVLARRGGGHLDLRCDSEGDPRLDIDSIVGNLPVGAHIYACGPAGLLAAFETATADLPRERVHLEHFGATQSAATEGGFTVRLARDGRSVPIPAGSSILDALLDLGLKPPHTCREGLCGACETAVLEGVPDHRDQFLTDAEMEEGRKIMICCSGAKSPVLVLDL